MLKSPGTMTALQLGRVRRTRGRVPRTSHPRAFPPRRAPRRNVFPLEPKSNRAVGAKIALDQLTWSPFWTAVFLTFLRILGGADVQSAWASIQSAWLPTMLMSYRVWPAAQLICFKWVPNGQRVLFNQVVSLLWVVYVSSTVTTATANAPPAPEVAEGAPQEVNIEDLGVTGAYPSPMSDAVLEGLNSALADALATTIGEAVAEGAHDVEDAVSIAVGALSSVSDLHLPWEEDPDNTVDYAGTTAAFAAVIGEATPEEALAADEAAARAARMNALCGGWLVQAPDAEIEGISYNDD
ncbi:unnamed protein product [Pedinophyceae sp. YPF-701]|nr:unnamed protein product [Pedinophyceae sp. YPF-701]